MAGWRTTQKNPVAWRSSSEWPCEVALQLPVTSSFGLLRVLHGMGLRLQSTGQRSRESPSLWEVACSWSAQKSRRQCPRNYCPVFWVMSEHQRPRAWRWDLKSSCWNQDFQIKYKGTYAREHVRVTLRLVYTVLHGRVTRVIEGWWLV